MDAELDKAMTTAHEDIRRLPLLLLEQQLLNEYQHGFPRTAKPFATLAEELGVTEQEVLATLQQLQAKGIISRVGPVFTPRRIGASTLAALQVPPEQLYAMAAYINTYPEVNHNYERAHDYNLWFVVTAPDMAHLEQVLSRIEQETGLSILRLPLIKDYHIDLGFRLWC